MKKFIFLTCFLFLTISEVNAEIAAPLPSCACNDLASQLNTDKNIEKQTRHEIKQMDYEADNLNTIDKQFSDDTTHKKKRKWLWLK